MLGSNVANAVGSTALVFGVLMLLASPFVYRGWQNRATYQAYAALPAQQPADATPGETVMITGWLADTDRSVTAPVHGEECLVALWRMSTYRRTGAFRTRAFWSEEGLGIDVNDPMLTDEHDSITLDGVTVEKELSAREKLGKLTGSKRDSVLRSISLALDNEGFEETVQPAGEWCERYRTLGARVGVQREESEPPGVLGRLLNTVRTPDGTVRFEEATLTAGESVTAVGTVTADGQRLDVTRSDAIDPLITRLSPSELRAKHRRRYRYQLYALPVVLLTFAVLMGAAVAV
ncbi:GIDE domain-containing protein [Salarchaeum japonicum]|uniref:GIDE domain-containing protein n=1 Tax=Salarchaeum japonicum TaxID=555573 RepID=UPI003C70A440